MFKIMLAIAGLGVVSMPAAAQEFPSRPVTLMMPYAAGGPGDTITRIIGQGMGKVLARNSWSKTPRVRAARSAPPKSRRRRPMATRCW